MSQARSAGNRVFASPSPSRLDWSDDKLAGLSTEQLRNLLENLDQQCAMGRVSDTSASELRERIAARLPKERRKPRPSRARELAELDERVGRNLRDLHDHVVQQYELVSKDAMTVVDGATGANAAARTKAAKAAAMAEAGIERAITYRSGESLAALAFHLRADQPHEAGRYLLVATSDLLADAVPLAECIPAEAKLGWTDDERGALRAQPAPNFAEAFRMYEALIGRVAARRVRATAQG